MTQLLDLLPRQQFENGDASDNALAGEALLNLQFVKNSGKSFPFHENEARLLDRQDSFVMLFIFWIVAFEGQGAETVTRHTRLILHEPLQIAKYFQQDKVSPFLNG